jgi:hypothetical protein
MEENQVDRLDQGRHHVRPASTGFVHQQQAFGDRAHAHGRDDTEVGHAHHAAPAACLGRRHSGDQGQTK